LVCHDFERGTSVERSFGRGAVVGEAVFVPRAADADEADGWLLALAYSPETDASALHIINAGDPTGDAQAVVELPQRVPVGFHGNWVPDTL
jgi:carotenoid cleavage dioxygenase